MKLDHGKLSRAASVAGRCTDQVPRGIRTWGHPPGDECHVKPHPAQGGPGSLSA